MIRVGTSVRDIYLFASFVMLILPIDFKVLGIFPVYRLGTLKKAKQLYQYQNFSVFILNKTILASFLKGFMPVRIVLLISNSVGWFLKQLGRYLQLLYIWQYLSHHLISWDSLKWIFKKSQSWFRLRWVADIFYNT